MSIGSLLGPLMNLNLNSADIITSQDPQSLLCLHSYRFPFPLWSLCVLMVAGVVNAVQD